MVVGSSPVAVTISTCLIEPIERTTAGKIVEVIMVTLVQIYLKLIVILEGNPITVLLQYRGTFGVLLL